MNFFHDVPEIQHLGKLRPVLIISAARLVGSYYKFERNISIGNIFVINVLKAEKLANIDDIHVTQAPDLRLNVILKHWYQKITDAFCNNSTTCFSQNESLRHHIE